MSALTGYEVDAEGVALLRLQRPDSRNAINTQMLEELLAHLASARADLEGVSGSIEFEEDPYEAAKDAHAIAILTEWDVYRTLDYRRIFDSMAKPAFVFDGRNILDHAALHAIGFNVFPIGKRPLK